LSFFGSLSRRIYAAFLIVAVVPTAVAGLIGVYLSLQTLRSETLRGLEQEVEARSKGIARFFDQLSSELLYLANTGEAGDLVAALATGNAERISDRTARMEQDYAAFARLYPYIYQIRFLAADGHELVRVDRKAGKLLVVPRAQLQSKADRYYYRETIGLHPGKIYVSPLDLNVEFGEVEVPETPVIRVATPVVGQGRNNAGIVIVNLHAAVLLEPVQRMADTRQGTAYLFDRSGHYLARSAGGNQGQFAMQPVEKLRNTLPQSLIDAALEQGASPSSGNGWILAHAAIDFAPGALSDMSRGRWKIGLAFQEREFFFAVFNLYVLYGVLLLALAATAIGGYALSRHLLRPLEELARETDAIAAGDFNRAVHVAGQDEIAALGEKFNRMAARINETYRSLQEHRDRLEDEVRARTRDLEQERASLEAVIRNTADGIMAVDRAGILRLINPAAMRLLNVSDVPDGLSLEGFWPQWPAIVKDAGMNALRCELEVPGGALALSVTPTTVGFIIVARDISREREIQDQRRELDRQMFQMEKLTTLGELAMGLAHEVGNPLAGMKAVAQAMQYEDDIPPGMIEALRRLESEVDRLSGFLRTFHGFAAPQPIQPVSCSLETILEDVLFFARKDARAKDIVFNLTEISELPPLWADPNQMKQVFLNLLMNAVHAMPEGGTVIISARTENRRARIEVSDTGAGIDPSVLTQIFEPFFTTRREGTGLGLAIVRKIVEQHGAHIEASSVPGRGTRFVLHWPLAGELSV